MYFNIYLVVCLICSVVSFILYALDKRKAIKNDWRIKEKVLLGSSFLFGSVGGLLGMYMCHHKTKHWYFVFFNFLFLILHVLAGYLIWKM